MRDNVNFARAYGQGNIDKSRISKRRLGHLDGYSIAKKVGCFYSGDVNTLDHGGYFYTLHPLDLDNGYTCAVQVTPDDETEGNYWIDALTVNLPDVTTERGRDELFDALASCGWDEDEEIGPHHIVDALIGYGTTTDRDSWYFRAKVLTENQALNLALDHLDLPGSRR